MNTVLDVLTVFGAIWTLLALGVVVAILWFGTRGEPADGDGGGELVPVDFRNGNHGRAA